MTCKIVGTAAFVAIIGFGLFAWFAIYQAVRMYCYVNGCAL